MVSLSFSQFRFINRFEAPLLSTVVQYFSAQFVLPSSVTVGRPVATEIANRTGARELGQLDQRCDKNGLNARLVFGRPESSADWVIDKHGPGRRNLTHNVTGRADHQRRDPLVFDDMGYETDGLMTKGSIGNQEREIDLGLL